MNYKFSIFSLIFFLAALTSLFWGSHIIRLKSERKINQVFLALSISLSIWSFGFAMANLSQGLENALFWRRFAAVGWTSLFSIMLHFLFLLTSKNKDGKRNKYLPLLHIPATISMYVFAISTNMAKLQYNLVKIDYGWTNKSVNNGWDFFYYSYYLLYMIAGLIIIWKWKNIVDEKMKIRQGNLIFASIIVAAVLGSFTDLISSSFLKQPLPQIAPLCMLIPIWAMYSSVRYYDLINSKKTYKEDLVASEEDQKNIFNKLSLAFYISAILSFTSEYIPYGNKEGVLKIALLKALTLIVLGALINVIQTMKNQSLREKLTIGILLASIPITLFQYLNYGSATVWAFPMVIIISAIIFSKRTLLISTTLVAIITQLIIWRLRPEVTVVINNYDYILRVGLFALALSAGLVINKIYVAKIKENDFRIKFQMMNAKISSDFITINKENADEKFNEMLSEMGLFFFADRVSLFLVNDKDGMVTYAHEWYKEGIASEIESFEGTSYADFPWWSKQLKNKKLVSIGDTSKMPKEASREKEELIKQNIKSVVSVPVNGKKRIKAFMVISSINSYRKWPKEDVELLHILANLLSDALLRIKSEKKVEYMAYYDSLTKLPNRVLFKDRVTKAIELAKKKNSLMSIIFMDLDNFKSVNDTIGHAGGDFLLKEVAKQLKKRVRKTDTVARFGGDEFMIMLNNVKCEKDISKVADNIMEMFSNPFNIEGQEFVITGSAGISILIIDGEDPETLIKNADTAMYEAKAKGKNGYAFCSDNMKEKMQKNITISNDLHYALEKEEFSLYYQPQMDLGNTEIIGLEALLRWNHPKLGMIPPKEFIPIAEKNGVIHEIGKWVLEKACRQNKKWQDMGLPKLSIAVNISAMEFINVKLPDQIQKVLQETGLNPKYLEIELTENIAIKETDFVIEVLENLKKIGVSIAIDDFGTEYSSLSRLRKLPIDRIKIDMEFIHGIENNDKDKAITSIIINLAKNLGLSVLAEGVETAPQLEFLNEKMCDYVQGYYYYKPMPWYEMEEVLKKAR